MKKGFTIIEILFAISILSLILTALLLRTFGIIDYAKERATRSEMEQLRKAIVGDQSIVSESKYLSKGYLGDVGSLPDNLSDLVTKPATIPDWDKFTEKGWNGPYIQNYDYDKDAWGNNYIYDRDEARIISKGKDGILGSSDDIIVYLLR